MMRRPADTLTTVITGLGAFIRTFIFTFITAFVGITYEVLSLLGLCWLCKAWHSHRDVTHRCHTQMLHIDVVTQC